jgi:hypothetical protein
MLRRPRLVVFGPRVATLSLCSLQLARVKEKVLVMSKAESKTQVLLARLAVVLMVVLAIFGAAWYGLSMEVFRRIGHNMLDRPGGPMTFRFILQPTMAAIAALHDGIKDARLGRSPYFWTVLTSRADRGGRLREGLISTARIILLGLVMDTIYQVIVLGTFYPGEAVIVTIALAFLPYLILRGPVARIARSWFGATPPDQAR